MAEYIERREAIDAIVNCTNCGTPDELRKYVDKHSLENGWTGGVLDAMGRSRICPPQMLFRWLGAGTASFWMLKRQDGEPAKTRTDAAGCAALTTIAVAE